MRSGFQAERTVRAKALWQECLEKLGVGQGDLRKEARKNSG